MMNRDHFELDLNEKKDLVLKEQCLLTHFQKSIYSPASPTILSAGNLSRLLAVYNKKTGK